MAFSGPWSSPFYKSPFCTKLTALFPLEWIFVERLFLFSTPITLVLCKVTPTWSGNPKLFENSKCSQRLPVCICPSGRECLTWGLGLGACFSSLERRVLCSVKELCGVQFGASPVPFSTFMLWKEGQQGFEFRLPSHLTSECLTNGVSITWEQ